MKNKLTILLALLLCVCLSASACGADVNSLENLCFAVADFNLARAADYVDDGEGYFATVTSLASRLDAEKAEIAKAIYSSMSFSEFSEEDGACTLTVKYIDFDRLKRDVDARINTGASATDVLSEIVESKGIARYTVTANDVKVMLRNDGEKVSVPLGYAGENAEFTKMLGLEAFLRWYILQE